jgi:hypothetical protein
MKMHIGMPAVSSAVCLLLAGANVAAQAEGPIVRLSTGIEYSSGEYGGTGDIEELYAPFTVRFDYSRVGFRLTIPYLSVTTPADDVAPGPVSTTTEDGLGDVIASVTLYDLFVSPTGDFVLDVSGKVKFGSADVDKGLGTGENDYTFLLNGYRFYERFALQGSAGYKVRGDPPGVELRDVFLGSIGGAISASDRTRLGMFFDYREASLVGGDAIQELSGFTSFRLNDRWRLEFYAFTGFGDNSPDWGGGMLLTTDLRQLRASSRNSN